MLTANQHVPLQAAKCKPPGYASTCQRNTCGLLEHNQGPAATAKVLAPWQAQFTQSSSPHSASAAHTLHPRWLAHAAKQTREEQPYYDSLGERHRCLSPPLHCMAPGKACNTSQPQVAPYCTLLHCQLHRAQLQHQHGSWVPTRQAPHASLAAHYHVHPDTGRCIVIWIQVPTRQAPHTSSLAAHYHVRPGTGRSCIVVWIQVLPKPA